jgi:hypothetical protein
MKPATTIAIAFLVLIALVQLTRFFLRWEVTINGIAIPVWLSGIAAVLIGALCVMLWRESRR